MSDVEKKAEHKPNAFARIGLRLSKWFREMRSELKKVVWPTPKQILNNTIIVIIAVILVGLLIFVLDWVFSSAIKWLISNYGGSTV